MKSWLYIVMLVLQVIAVLVVASTTVLYFTAMQICKYKIWNIRSGNFRYSLCSEYFVILMGLTSQYYYFAVYQEKYKKETNGQLNYNYNAWI